MLDALKVSFLLSVDRPLQQPTRFEIRVHRLKDLVDNSVLLLDLKDFAEYASTSSEPSQLSKRDSAKDSPGSPSFLLLQIFSAADYFTTNETLMNFPPPVDVDISQFPPAFPCYSRLPCLFRHHFSP